MHFSTVQEFEMLLQAMGFSNGQKKLPAAAIREKLGDLRERLAECQNNKVRMEQKSTTDPTPYVY